ncbi:hypothetical protein Halru_3018 [Halovivax ruber XH-70]|uniref:Uncharacterized protein n=1 Tax=Halovivax ruber (strain DSM 18193 / JCM 13892 / XH-70) TaxID=797302 RepID=L0IFP3_HALRX|nr:hypothetical protein Halru_3018 [Halovivax ruber XH-70]
MTTGSATDSSSVWWFEDVPCGRTRKQGLIQKKTFSRDLETFVREILQNSVDARYDPSEPVQVTFRLRELDDRTAFEEAIQWDDLYAHVKAGGKDQDGHGLADYVKYLENGGAFRLLTIEEKNAKGIQGNEEDQDSDYAALIRDPGASNKGGSTGGRHGLGSTLLWVTSGFQTVLFNSTLAEERPGQTSPRLVGRCFIPTHDLSEGECYSNDGWFGSESGFQRDELKRPESIWNDQAEVLAEDLGMARPDANGTTIMIPGFRDPSDPAMDDQPSPDELYNEFIRATAEYFWPAIRGGNLQVEIDVCGEDTRLTQETIQDNDLVSPFVECFDRMRNASDSFNGPGTVAKTDQEYGIVSKKEGECDDNEEYPTPTEGHVTVAARKANPSDTEGSPSERLGEVAMFRGPGMVVKYKSGHYLGHSGKYHALLAAGKARTPSEESHSPSDEAIDDFLAMAEPPMHDRWYGKKNDELKAKYESGCVGPAEDLTTKTLRSALSKILYSRSDRSGTLTRPHRDILPRTRSDLRTEGGTKKPPSPSIPPLFEWHISDRIAGDEWLFSGTVGPNSERKAIGDGPIEEWEATFELVALFEDNREADTVVVEDIDAEVADGSGQIDVAETRENGEKSYVNAVGDVRSATVEIEAQLDGVEARLGDLAKTRLKLDDGSVEVGE